MKAETSTSDTESRPRLRQQWGRSFTFWRNCFIGLIVVSPLLSRMWFLSKVPDIDVPFDVEAFCRNEISDDQNAFVHYREAMRLLDAIDAADRLKVAPENFDCAFSFSETVVKDGWTDSNQAMKSWLADRRSALIEWQRGTECAAAVGISIRDLDLLSSKVNDCHSWQFCRIAHCEAARLEAEGRFVEAKKWLIAMLRSSRHVGGRQSGRSERFTGAGLHSFSTKALIRWTENPGVDSAILRTTLDEIRAAFQMTVPESTNLKAEYILVINDFERRDWVAECGYVEGFRCGNGLYVEEPQLAGMKVYYWLTGEPQRAQRILRQSLVNQLKEIDKPLPERRPAAQAVNDLLFDSEPGAARKSNELTPAAIDRAFQRSHLSRLVKPNYSFYRTLVLAERVWQATLEVALAAQAYQRDHGEFPPDSTALIPEYLDAWPIDPFDKIGRPLLYHRKTLESAVVWSIGRNGDDDNGDIGDIDRIGFDIGVELKLR